MPDYLLEIGVEELPASEVVDAQERLQRLMAQALEQANLPYEEIVTLGTPRRLACIVKQLAQQQETTTKKVKGPPVKSSFDSAGQPLPPAAGFAAKQGLTVADLDREEIGGITYLVANLTIAGRSADQVLAAVAPKVIEQISGERLMRWGSSELKFTRPIRWVVSLLDQQVVPFHLYDITAGNQSYGHRILAPAAVKVSSPGSYKEDLRRVYVLVDPSERRQVIEREVVKAASSVGGVPRQLKGALLAEVVNLTEWPCAVLGEFSSEYLDLPDTLIETVMVHHQRYFPVEQKTGDGRSKLLPYFISVANNDRIEATRHIKLGNERVLRARLADGRFFYFDDQKTALSDRGEALANLTYHEGLGSYIEKQSRLVAAARALLAEVTLDTTAKLSVSLEAVLQLCKLDLVTTLVRELPELQGFVGSWYAACEGQPAAVAAAIASHYSPRSTDDSIPTDTLGRMAAVLDKLDNLVCLFATGKRPSGSSDPYILRRQAQGLIDILMDGLNEYSISITALIEVLLRELKGKLAANKRWADGATAGKGIADLRDFLEQRIKLKLLERGYKRELVDAVLAAGDPLADLPDVIVRANCLEQLTTEAGGVDLIRAGVRIGNILTAESQRQVNPELFEDDAERNLWEAFNQEVVSVWQAGGEFRAPRTQGEYATVLGLLRRVAPLVDRLFDCVMVNDADQSKRNNRHAILKNLDCYFRSVADFPKLQPLLLQLDSKSL